MWQPPCRPHQMEDGRAIGPLQQINDQRQLAARSGRERTDDVRTRDVGRVRIRLRLRSSEISQRRWYALLSYAGDAVAICPVGARIDAGAHLKGSRKMSSAGVSDLACSHLDRKIGGGAKACAKLQPYTLHELDRRPRENLGEALRKDGSAHRRQGHKTGNSMPDGHSRTRAITRAKRLSCRGKNSGELTPSRCR
jgi:hypothetical protein